jgi:hypothetical protein
MLSTTTMCSGSLILPAKQSFVTTFFIFLINAPEDTMVLHLGLYSCSESDCPQCWTCSSRHQTRGKTEQMQYFIRHSASMTQYTLNETTRRQEIARQY